MRLVSLKTKRRLWRMENSRILIEAMEVAKPFYMPLYASAIMSLHPLKCSFPLFSSDGLPNKASSVFKSHGRDFISRIVRPSMFSLVGLSVGPPSESCPSPCACPIAHTLIF